MQLTGSKILYALAAYATVGPMGRKLLGAGMFLRKVVYD